MNLASRPIEERCSWNWELLFDLYEDGEDDGDE